MGSSNAPNFRVLMSQFACSISCPKIYKLMHRNRKPRRKQFVSHCPVLKIVQAKAIKIARCVSFLLASSYFSAYSVPHYMDSKLSGLPHTNYCLWLLYHSTLPQTNYCIHCTYIKRKKTFRQRFPVHCAIIARKVHWNRRGAISARYH